MELKENSTVGTFFDRQAASMPGQKALISEQGDFTFQDLKKTSDQLARSMIDWGIKSGDHVAVWAHNIPEWEFLFLALSKIGAILIPLNPNLRFHDLSYDLAKADVDYLFLISRLNGTDYLEILHQAVPDLDHIICHQAFEGIYRDAVFQLNAKIPRSVENGIADNFQVSITIDQFNRHESGVSCIGNDVPDDFGRILIPDLEGVG